jgi:DNA-binding transcriptional MocR family regulator
MFDLSRDSAVPLVDQIATAVTAQVKAGQLPAGARLPSIRKLARLVGASPFTVVDAYDRLVARGVIEARAGRGFFVTTRQMPARLAAIEALPDPGSDVLALASVCLIEPENVIAAGSGFLPESWLLETSPAAMMRRISRGRRPAAFLPCPPQGVNELREQIAARLGQRGIPASPGQIMTTYGSSHAFDLLARLLLTPGDAVLVEDPGYFVLFEQLRTHHVRLIPVPRRPDGPDLAALEEACRAHRPRALFIQTLLHNPTGWNAQPASCHRVLSLAEQYGFAVVEDDVYGDLYEGPAVRLAQIDGFRHVIHLGSYTKLIGPALRVGFVAAEPGLIGRLVERKVLSVLSGSGLLECFVSEVLDSGRYNRHVQQVRARLARLRREVHAGLARAGIRFEPEGGEGIFLWGRIPDGHDAQELVRRGQERSILLAKGSLFSPQREPSPWLRFNVAHSARPQLMQFLGEAFEPRRLIPTARLS